MLATRTPVPIPKRDFEIMLRFARQVHGLKHLPCYLSLMQSRLPVTAQVRSDVSSLLMGYDFHLTSEGPKLIEINNNAGGLFLGSLSEWIPQPLFSEWVGSSLESRLLRMFPTSWHTIAILDENIEQQFMYPEMQAYARLLESDGRKVLLVSPEDVKLQSDGLYVNAVRLDAVYNRHTDFYLEQSEMAHVRQAFEQGLVALNPFPRSYALLGDKARMVDWWRAGWLDGCVSDTGLSLIRDVVPETHIMAEQDLELLWQTRKDWVFKPVASHAGKGVLLGKSISRTRFDALDVQRMVAQAFVSPSTVRIADQDYKFDVRLYMHGAAVVAVAGRCWQGQVTNFRAAGSGWAALDVGD